MKEKSTVTQLRNPASFNADPLNALLKEGAKSLIQMAIEAELKNYLSQYEDFRTVDNRQVVVRNGYLPEREIQTGVGPINVKIPKVRSRTDESFIFKSTLIPPYVRKSKSLECVIPWLYLKGISTGDMEEPLMHLVGADAKGLSASTITRLKQIWGNEYKEWQQRDLSKDKWVYIWADGIHSGFRKDESSKLCTLVVIGVNEYGQKHFLAIEDGTRESTQSWREVLLHLKQKGVSAPQLGIGDGALGFWAALDEVYPETRHQRCWVHKMANVLNHMPKALQPKAKSDLQEIWMSDTKENAEIGMTNFVEIYGAKYIKSVENLKKDKDSLLAFYDFPAEHWPSIRTSNPIESVFGTIRHRTRQSKGCLSRDGMLHMIFKLGISAEKNWRKIRGFQELGKVLTGIKFRNGIEVKLEKNKKAA
jgi:transposase-like protein